MKIIIDYAHTKGIYDVNCNLVGSVAKKTSLIGKADIDIFMTFPLSYSDDDLKKYGLEFGQHCIDVMNGKSEKRYASHPYITGLINGFEVDFVPCYNIKDASELKSAVDRTILHTKYVKSHMTDFEADQVLLLKKFMTSINTYGANYKVSGFSGYLCELLILKYGSFINVITSAANEWCKKFSIDLENYSTSCNYKDPLIVIDPVDKNRNVAAALSIQKYSEFIIASRNYLDNPCDDYFIDRDIKTTKEEMLSDYNNRDTKCFVISFNIPHLPSDIIYPQVNKTMKSIVKTSFLKDFRVLNSSYYINHYRAHIILEYEVAKLPEIKIHTGPSIMDNKNGKFFLNKYPHAFIDKDKWIVYAPRKYNTVENMIRDLFKKENMSILKLGKNIKEEILNEYKIDSIESFIKSTNDNELNELYLYLHPCYRLIR